MNGRKMEDSQENMVIALYSRSESVETGLFPAKNCNHRS